LHFAENCLNGNAPFNLEFVHNNMTLVNFQIIIL